ncbi:MAG: hypothetical protein K0R24_1740 [Gammaproteobacteria bacterium]|jgi:hypothetical protein|nr:hypothetical protein [Gammaproteobacteria bacterium]
MRYLKFIIFMMMLSIIGCKHTPKTPSSSDWSTKEITLIHAKAPQLNLTALKLSLTAYQKARQQGLDTQQLLTVIDYSKPSNERRLWVINLKTNTIVLNTWVAHGKNSGGLNATSFSNNARSLKSSLGVFITENSYIGSHGYSMRIQGLEQGINDNVYHRAVVFHGARYVGADVAKSRGMLGRSWGCMAVGQDTIKPLVDTIKNKTVVVAYYPEPNWLKNSKYINV